MSHGVRYPYLPSQAACRAPISSLNNPDAELEMMNTCIYTRESFEKSSGEHLLQNFLGARWTSKKIVCNHVQSIFGETIDSALEQSLRSFRNLLGTKGGRRGDAPSLRNITGSQGNQYHIESGGIPRLSKPLIASRALDNGQHEVSIKVADMNQFDWAMAEVRRRFPEAQLDPDAWRSTAQVSNEYLTEQLHIRSGIGGLDYFRAILKAAFNLLGANASDTALHPCFDEARNFILTGSGDIAQHIRWPDSSIPQFELALGKFDHVIYIHSRGNVVEGIVEFFGGIGHLIRLSNQYSGKDFFFGYRVNPLRNSKPPELRNPSVNRELIPTFQRGYEEPDEDARGIFMERLARFFLEHSTFAREIEIARIVDDFYAAHKGKILSTELAAELTNSLSLFMQSLLVRRLRQK